MSTLTRFCAVLPRVSACWSSSAFYQGVGGGGRQPSEQAILNDKTFPLSKREWPLPVYGIAVGRCATLGRARAADH